MKNIASPRLLVLLGLLLTGFLRLAAQPTPLPQAHAHNDYEHKRPLLDALDHGFCSVEADIWLVDGQLLVAHTRWSTAKERTLEKLYLDPLRERVRQNGGRVHPKGPPCTLLVDLKSEPEEIYAVLRGVLERYVEMLTVFTTTNTVTNAVTVILTGGRPARSLPSETKRLAALDGRLSDLESNPSPALVPWISESWASQFKWRGTGALPDSDREKLERILTRAHQQGRRVRFWATPDNPIGWKTLRDAGVDFLNTDDLAGLQKFLLENPR